MKELLREDSQMIFPETWKYTYKRKREFHSGLEQEQQAYNKNMKHRIIFLKNESANYQQIEQYLKKIAKGFQKIQIDEKKLGGMPVIKNTRIPISLIVACFKDEMSIEEICKEYQLTEEDVITAMEYVIEVLDTPYQEGLE